MLRIELDLIGANLIRFWSAAYSLLVQPAPLAAHSIWPNRPAWMLYSVCDAAGSGWLLINGHGEWIRCELTGRSWTARPRIGCERRSATHRRTVGASGG